MKKSLSGIFFIVLCLNLRAQDTLTISEYFKEIENCSFYIENKLPKKVFKIVKSIFDNKKNDVKLIIKLKNNLEIDIIYDDKLIYNEKLYKSIEKWLSLSNIGFFNMQNFDTCNLFNCSINFNFKDKTAYYANSSDFYDKIIDTFNNSSSDYFLINDIIIIKDHYHSSF